MSLLEEIYIAPQPDRWITCPGLRVLSRLVIRLYRHEKTPTLARKALAVTEPAGWTFCQRHPSREPRVEGDPITVFSANLWHDWPRYRRLQDRLEAFSQMVEAEKADIILLQEVTRTRWMQVDEWLAERLGMAYVYTRANGHQAIGFEEGLSILSRFPITGLPLLRQLGPSCNPFARRIVLGARLLTPYGEVLALSVHLGLVHWQNALQLKDLHGWLDSLAITRPVILGGDFNAEESSPQIQQARSVWMDTFRHLHQLADGTTHELRYPWGKAFRRRRLDYIFLRQAGFPWIVHEAHHLDAPGGPHSDHRAVLVRVTPGFSI